MWIVIGWDYVIPIYPNGEGGYEVRKFQQEIGGTAVCTKTLMMTTKGFDQLMSNDTYFFIAGSV